MLELCLYHTVPAPHTVKLFVFFKCRAIVNIVPVTVLGVYTRAFMNPGCSVWLNYIHGFNLLSRQTTTKLDPVRYLILSYPRLP